MQPAKKVGSATRRWDRRTVTTPPFGVLGSLELDEPLDLRRRSPPPGPRLSHSLQHPLRLVIIVLAMGIAVGSPFLIVTLAHAWLCPASGRTRIGAG